MSFDIFDARTSTKSIYNLNSTRSNKFGVSQYQEDTDFGSKNGEEKKKEKRKQEGRVRTD